MIQMMEMEWGGRHAGPGAGWSCHPAHRDRRCGVRDRMEVAVELNESPVQTDALALHPVAPT